MVKYKLGDSALKLNGTKELVTPISVILYIALGISILQCLLIMAISCTSRDIIGHLAPFDARVFILLPVMLFVSCMVRAASRFLALANYALRC